MGRPDRVSGGPLVSEDRERRVPSMVFHPRRELKILVLAFGVPFVALLVFDLVNTPSPLSWWKRILTFEDVCTHGMCFILPVIIYVCVRLFVGPARTTQETGLKNQEPFS